MTPDISQVHIEASWTQAWVSVFLMDSPALIAALVFFFLLVMSEGKKR